MTKLYELTDELQSYLAMVDDDGQLSQEALEGLDRLEVPIQQKFIGCCQVLRNYQADVEAFKAESARLARHARTAENNVERLKAYIAENLQKMELDSFDAGLFRLRLQNNPPSCQVDADLNVETLPPYLVKRTIEVDRRACLQFAKGDGPLPPGIQIVQTKSLRIS